MENVLICIASSIILPIVYGIFYCLKEKEEKKIGNNATFTVKTSKWIILFFLIWMIICFLGMVGGVVLLLVWEETNENLIFWIIETVSFIFFLLGGVGFAIVKYNYLVVKDEGIYLKKMFKKDKLIRYSDITYISSNSLGFGQLGCYDSDGIPLFEIDQYHVGMERLETLLRNKGYFLLPTPYPSQEMKSSVKFQHYKKVSSSKVAFWCFLSFGIASLLLGVLINCLSTFTEYENYEVVGVVERYRIDEESLEIHLKDDEKIYYVNGIVYDELNEEVYNELNENTEVKLRIAYKDKKDRYKISQLEIEGGIYLYMDKSESAEYSNYRNGLITSYVFAGIAFGLVILSLVYFIRIKKLKRES